MTVGINAGLSDAEVAARVAEGKTNDVPNRASRSVADIVRANVLTRINAILGVLFAIVLATGSLINGLFGLLIVANSAIGIIQELRAKKTLDNLAIVSQAKPRVRRRAGTRELPPNDVVLDDVIEIGPGDQIVVDGELLEAAGCEIDESLLTGEADPIAKTSGDEVMSGSCVVAGTGAYRAPKVGREASAARLAEEASKFTLVKSELRSGIDLILRFITYLLVPAGLLIIYTQLFLTNVGWRESVLRMVGALVPMVPEGLVLMTSIAFAVGVVRLGRRQCLVQELPAIEGLARVDVVCADKTGTLTENGMRLSETTPLGAASPEQVGEVLAALAADDTRPNASMIAIAEAYPQAPHWTSTAVAPFKSATKWSGASFGAHGNWVIGAPDVRLVLREMPNLQQVQALDRGDIDLGILYSPLTLSARLRQQLLASYPIVAAVPERMRVGDDGRVSLRDVARAGLVTFEQTQIPLLRSAVLHALSKLNEEYRVVQEVGHTLTLLACVGNGIGAALLPSGTRQVQFPGVRYCEIREQHLLPVLQLSAVWRARSRPSLADHFARTLHSASLALGLV